MSKADRAMGDIDAAASPSSQNSPPDPGKILGSIDLANHGGVNSFNNVAYEQQCPGSTVSMDNASFMDDVAQYIKTDKAGLMQVRNQAYGLAVPNSQTPLIGKQDSDPAGG